MGAVGGVAILGGNFEAPTFPEDKVVQRSLTAGTQESSAIDAVILDALPLGAPGQLDSHAFLWKGHSHNGTPHTIDWKAFVNVTADDGTGSLWTLQTRIDGAPYTDILTVDDNGLLTVSGATFTMDQLIIDADNTEAVLVRKDGDAGDVFIVDTVNDVVRMGSDATFLTFGASSDAQIHRGDAADILEQRRGLNPQEWRLYDRFVSFADYDRLAVYIGGGPPLKTIEFVAETSNASQGINIDIEALPGGSSDGRITLITGTTQLQVAPFAASINKVFNISTASSSSMTVNGFISSLGFGFAPGIAINIDTFGSNRDSHSINMIGSGNLGNRATWKTFVDVIDVTANSIWTLQNDLNGGGFNDLLTISNAGLVSLPVSGSALAFGPSPAQSGTIRLQNLDTIIIRNAANTDDHFILESLVSDEYNMFDPLIGRVDHLPANTRFFKRVEVHVDGTSTSALIVRSFNFDTTNEILRVGAGSPPGATVHGGVATSFAIINQAASGTVPTLIPRRDSLTTGIGAATADQLSFINGGTETAKILNGGRFAINLPEQVSIGSPTFIDNVQLHITGSFVDDYGGGPTETHKVRITGSQTGDTGRTNRQTIFDIAGASIITQNLSQTIDEVGGMSLFRPSITPGTDTINKTYTLKVMNASTVGTENYGVLVDNSVNNPTAYVRIGKSAQTGLKLLVGGGPGGELLDANAQMRLTNFFTNGAADYAVLLHVHSTLQPISGTTDHITGAFFQGSLRTQVATENVANISQVRIDEPNIQDSLTGDITNAQSLLITGAPTEGESNYALRILGGDLQISNSSSFLMRNAGDDGELSIFFSPQSDELTFGDVNMPKILIPTNVDMRKQLEVQFDSTAAFFVWPGSGAATLNVDTTNREVTADGNVLRFRADSSIVGSNNLEIRQARTSVSTAAGSSVTAAGLIPAGSFVIGVNVRVLTLVTGPTGFDVGDGIDVDRWGNSIAVAGSTTTTIVDYTTGAVTTFQVANDVVITSDGVDFTGGTIRIVVNYLTLTGPIN